MSECRRTEECCTLPTRGGRFELWNYWARVKGSLSGENLKLPNPGGTLKAEKALRKDWGAIVWEIREPKRFVMNRGH